MLNLASVAEDPCEGVIWSNQVAPSPKFSLSKQNQVET